MPNDYIDSIFNSMIGEQIKPVHFAQDAEVNSIARERRAFLNDPTNIEKNVSHLMRSNLPMDKQVKIGYGSDLAKVNKAFPSDDPRASLGSKIMEESNLAISMYPNMHPQEVINKVYRANIEEKKPEIFNYLDSAQKGFLGIPFTGKTLGKNLTPIEGYEKYLQDKEDYQKNNINFGEMSSPISAMLMGGIPAAAAHFLEPMAAKQGAGMAVRGLAKAAGMLTSNVAKAIPNPLLRVGLTALAAVPEFWAFELAGQLATKNDVMKEQPWYVKMPVELAAGGAAFGAMSKTIGKGFEGIFAKEIAMKEAAGKVAVNPVLSNVLEFNATSNAFNKVQAEKFKYFDEVFNGMESTAAKPKDEIGTGKFYDDAVNIANQRGISMQEAVKEVITPEGIIKNKSMTAFDAYVKDVDSAMSSGKGFKFMEDEELMAGIKAINPKAEVMESNISKSLDDNIIKEMSNIDKVAGNKIKMTLTDDVVPDIISTGTKGAPKVKVKGLSESELFANKISGMPEEEQVKTLTEEFSKLGSLNKMYNFADKLGKIKGSGEGAEVINTINRDIMNKALTNAQESIGKKIDYAVNTARNIEAISPQERAAAERISRLEELGKNTSKLEKEFKKTFGYDYSPYIAPVVAAGALIPLLSLASPSDANAGPISDKLVTGFTKDILEKSGIKNVVSEILDKKYFVAPYVKDSFQMPEKGMSIGGIAPSVQDVVRKVSKWWDRIASPNVVWETMMKQGQNPMMDIASREVTSQMNAKGWAAFTQDVLDRVPGVMEGSDDIAAVMKKYASTNSLYIQKNIHDEMIGNLEKDILKLTRKAEGLKGDDLKFTQDEIAGLQAGINQHKEGIAKIAPEFDKRLAAEGIVDYNASWEKDAKILAEKYPTARIFLALDGKGLSAEDPWVLKYMTNEEKIAVGHLKDFHNKIRGYIKDVGGEAFAEGTPYIHYAPHPSIDFKELAKGMEEFNMARQDILPLAKMFSRSRGSLPLLPDVRMALGEYIPDTARRIEMIDFWKKGRPGGWDAFNRQVHQLGWRGPADAMERIRASFSPEQVGTVNDLARKFYSFEAARLIALNPGPGGKHLMKLIANLSNFGPKAWMESIGPASQLYHKAYIEEAFQKATGSKASPEIITDMLRTFTQAGNMSAILQDLGVQAPKGWVDKISEKAWNWGGAIINNTERFDRAVSFTGAMMMAQKKGMTAEQAMYSMYDTILKTNFLSGQQNPAWLRNPKVRMMMMFQGTPFKLLEQRLLLGARGGKDILGAGKEVWNQLQSLKGDIKEGEQIFKTNLIKNALTQGKDIYGIPYSYQMMRQMMALGTVIAGGAALFDADMTGHALHVPILKVSEGGKPAFNPAITAALEAKSTDEDFWVSDFFKKWFSQGPFPAAFVRGWRLTGDDIPKIYRDSKFRYLFAIPATKEK